MPAKTRNILLPISLIYGGVVATRNWLYDKKIFRSAKFDFPVICVGNLAVGGTGKSPMVEYLVSLLKTKYVTATLSRGYKRKTKGFLIADEKSQAADIGDEPMQFHQKFPDLTVAVAEERVIGIPQLLFAKPETRVIILDDAFQHREVAAGLNLLLTDYNNLYPDDKLLPAGSLRDKKISSQRADIIIVTKCISNLTIEEKNVLIQKIKPSQKQKIFFTTIVYKDTYHLFTHEKLAGGLKEDILLVCGIANPKNIKAELSSRSNSVKTMRFKDHHVYNLPDINKIKENFSAINSVDKIIITTEKDAGRLSAFENELKDLPVFVLPMAHQFLFGEKKKFEELIFNFVESYKSASDVEPD
ncbi:MAG: tetraacyldisaccharide 4'-kinase [Ginsengibacter sp.]